MADLKILNVSDDIIKSLDAIVKTQQYSDRSALIRNILEKYVQFGDAFLVRQLPDTVRLLVSEALKEYPEKLSNMLQFQMELAQKNITLLNELYSYFSSDIGSDIN